MDSSAFQKPAQTKKPRTYTNDGILEALRGLGGGVGKTVSRDVAGKVASDALASLFGTHQSGELTQNETIDLTREHTPRPSIRRPDVQPAPARSEDAQIKQQIEAVRAELKALASSVAQLNAEIKKTVAEVPVDPGIYHLNFFERLRSVLAILREQVDDSRSWLALSSNRKQKKMGYWGMYKKHGTTFGLSNERSLATQAG